MEMFFTLNRKQTTLLFLLADTLCVGAGMGVPIFCILFGFPLGWYIARRILLSGDAPRLIYPRILKISLLTTGYTFFLLVAIWSAAILINIHSTADIPNFGHPSILFDPVTSFYGWLVLMVLVSPFLQLLTTIFAAFVTLLRLIGRDACPESAEGGSRGRLDQLNSL